MNNSITLREISSSRDIARFWREKDAMLLRDVQPNCDLDGPMTAEEVARLLAPAYRERVEAICSRRENPGYRFFFQEDGREVGFAFCVLYDREDGKCFLAEFCIYPPYRCRGVGKACFAALAERMAAAGAAYVELSTYCHRARRFWESLGFRYNGYSEGEDILFCRPPAETVPIAVERLTDPEDPDLGWQLRKLENGYLAEIGEALMTDEKMDRLTEAIRREKITFFLARRGYRAVGMCSVSPCFSTFSCGETGVFEDFYVEPVFRRQGAARALAQAAQDWSRSRDMASLTVCCAPVDEEMYRSLGFTAPLGRTLAHLTKR